MAETLAASIKLTVNATLSGDSDLGDRKYNLPYSKTISFTNGNGANQSNQIWADTRTVVASGTDSIDLSGVLTSALGTTLTFTKIKAIIIAAAGSNTNNLIVGGNANAMVNWVGDASDTVTIRPGGFICLTAPDATAYGVTAGTGDILDITNSAGTTGVTYDIIVIGVV